jgi:nitrite reductase/ring-hydroxylating ferredoxin subunit
MREARLPLLEAPAEGEVRLLDVGKHRIGLFRVGDELHALANRCPHRGAALCEGRVATPIELNADGPALGMQSSILRCPWHKWEFEIATGRCLVDEKLRVRRYVVQTEADEIVISLDQPKSPQRARGSRPAPNSSSWHSQTD